MLVAKFKLKSSALLLEILPIVNVYRINRFYSRSFRLFYADLLD